MLENGIKWKTYSKKKINCISLLNNQNDIYDTNEDNIYFITGSWDSQKNHITIQSIDLPNNDKLELEKEFYEESIHDPSEYFKTHSSIQHNGDVTCLNILSHLDKKLVFSGSTNGFISTYDIIFGDMDNTFQIIPSKINWNDSLFMGAVTSIQSSVYSKNVLFAGEDGKIIISNLGHPNIIDKIDTDCIGINDMKLLGTDTLFAIVGKNYYKPFQLWDLKSSRTKPITVFKENNVRNSNRIYKCIENHPSRPECFVTGGRDGSISIWDRRKIVDGPLNTFCQHKNTVLDIKFHPTEPRNIYSCGEDGKILAWNFLHNPTIINNKIPEMKSNLLNKSFLPWNACVIHDYHDTLIACSDDYRIVAYKDIKDVFVP